MDINARYEALCKELGHLDSEISMREERRAEIRAEMKALQRIASAIGPQGTPPDSAAPGS